MLTSAIAVELQDDVDDEFETDIYVFVGIQFKSLLLSQFTHPPDTEKTFGSIYALDLNDVFRKKKPRFNKRTSSAAWDEPLLPNPFLAKF